MPRPIHLLRPLLIAAALAAGAGSPAHGLEFLDRLADFAEQTVTATPGKPGDPPPFRVGLVLPERGALREPAARILAGWRIAAAMSDGYVGERPIELVAIDSSVSPEAAVEAARRKSRDAPIDVYAGVLGARTAAALAAFAETERKPLILAGAIGEEILAGRCRPHVARTSFSIGPYITASGRFLAGKAGAIVTVAPESEGSFQIIRRFTGAYRAAGGRILEQIWAPQGQQHDWSGLLARSVASGPAAVYAFFEERNAERIVYQYSTMGLKDSIALTGPEWLFGPRTLGRRGKHAAGARFLTAYLPTRDEPANRIFAAAYRTAQHEAPDIYAYMGYENALAVLLTAAETEGTAPDGVSFVRAMRQVEYTGLMPRGAYAFNAVNSAVLTHLYWVEAVYDGDTATLRELATIPIDADRAECGQQTRSAPRPVPRQPS